MKLNLPITEQRNPKSMHLDQMSALEIVELMNEEDHQVQKAVASQLPVIAKVTELISDAFAQGGRLFYFGAGTSGRLGVLDSSECPPTFGVTPEQVQGVIAGGDSALRSAVESAEDNPELGRTDVRNRSISATDIVVGLAASGRTPYVRGVLEEAKARGAITVLVCCNPDAPLIPMVDYAIVPVVGPEILTGSSRLKAGSAQKQVLNMLTTGAFVLQGKVYSNLMVDLRPTNEKLIDRAVRMIMLATECSRETAEAALQKANLNVRLAIDSIVERS